jgi:ATP-dependent 26S proteasome regulatory subunit
MESYRGLAILATNMKSALDQAFVRRLRFVVDFSYPAPAERQHIWRLAFPDETPLEELDYDRLAKLSLSGGNIHNIALGAAFMAAAVRSAVTMDMVLAATQIELRKHERPDIRV